MSSSATSERRGLRTPATNASQPWGVDERRLPPFPATKLYCVIKDFKAERNARLLSFQILVNTWSTFYEAPFDGADNRRPSHPSLRKIFPKPVHLMHPLVQDRHDANIPVRQPPPVHEMMLVPEVEAVDGELCRDRPRRDAMHLDLAERCKEIGDVAISLFSAPTVARVAVDLVKPQRCSFLDADSHVAIPGSGR
jgi:hypothetical protein